MRYEYYDPESIRIVEDACLGIYFVKNLIPDCDIYNFYIPSFFLLITTLLNTLGP